MKFERVVLPNGITIYARKTDDPFAIAKIVVPVGHMHNVGLVTPGTAHFLEHMVCNRSDAFPDIDSYNRFVGLSGGKSNASTSISRTEYWVSASTHTFKQAFSGLVSRVFRPVLDESDLRNEITVISNERNRKSKWYPGENKLEKYLKNEWRWSQPVSLRQVFGSDDDLAQMNVRDLRLFHQNYFDSRVHLIIGGSFDLDFVIQQLLGIVTAPRELPFEFRQNSWVNPTFHEVALSETNRFIYKVAGISDSNSIEQIAGLKFLLTMLTNSIHGPLFHWLRNELGWSYELGYSLSAGYDNVLNASWSMDMPVQTREQAMHVRAAIHTKILEAITNNELIRTEVRRMVLGGVFSYQRLGDCIKAAESCILYFGRIINEEEETAIINFVSNPDFLRAVYDKYIAPNVMGEILISPVSSVT